jgi:hypothetical protein
MKTEVRLGNNDDARDPKRGLGEAGSDLAGDLVRDGLGMIPVVGPFVGSLERVVRRLFPSGDDSYIKAVSSEIEDAILSDLPRLNARVEALEEEQRPKRSSALVILERHVRSYTSTTDPRKQRLINAALSGQFQPHLQQAGVVDRLWALLDELDYGDLHFLMDVYRRVQTAGEAVRPWQTQNEMPRYHAERTANVGLLVRNPVGTAESNTPAILTYLGKQMVELISENARPEEES